MIGSSDIILKCVQSFQNLVYFPRFQWLFYWKDNSFSLHNNQWGSNLSEMEN